MKLSNIDRCFARWRASRRVDASSATEPLEESAFWKWGAIVPHLLASALISAALVLGVLRVTGGATPRVVVFDILKYANAQRAVAERLVRRKESDEAAAILLDLSVRTRMVIQEVAGRDALVVIRQAIVRGETHDITDDVLHRLGLPTHVPTADAAQHVFDIAPTLLGAGPRMTIEAPAAQSPSQILP